MALNSASRRSTIHWDQQRARSRRRSFFASKLRGISTGRNGGSQSCGYSLPCWNTDDRGGKLLAEQRTFPTTVVDTYPQLLIPDHVLKGEQLIVLQTTRARHLRECRCALARLQMVTGLRGAVTGLYVLARGLREAMGPGWFMDTVVGFTPTGMVLWPGRGGKLPLRCNTTIAGFLWSPTSGGCQWCAYDLRTPARTTEREWSADSEALRRLLVQGLHSTSPGL